MTCVYCSKKLHRKKIHTLTLKISLQRPPLYNGHFLLSLAQGGLCREVRLNVNLISVFQLASFNSSRRKPYQSLRQLIVGTLPPNAVFSHLAPRPPNVFFFKFNAVNSPNLVHQHWKSKKTAKCPNNLNETAAEGNAE